MTSLQVNASAIVLIGIFYALHSVTGRHAVNQRQDTPVGELFKYVCDSIATVFLMALLGSLLGADTPVTLWYCVQFAQLILFWKHVSVNESPSPTALFKSQSLTLIPSQSSVSNVPFVLYYVT